MGNIARAMKILELTVGAADGVRVTDIAGELGLNRAIPYRIFMELIDLGYVQQDETTDRFRATFMVGSLGLRQLETSKVIRWAQSDLDQLARKSRELARLSVASGMNLRFVAQAQGASGTLVINSPVSPRVSLHATAAGKAFLSASTSELIDQYLAQEPMERFTDRTVQTREEILSDLEEARRVGYALVEEEAELGVSSVASPIIPPETNPPHAVGAISIAGPTVRMSRARLRTLGEECTATANRLAGTWHVFKYLQVLTNETTD